MFHKFNRMGLPTDNEPEVYESFKISDDKKEITFSRGCLSKIKKLLKKRNHKVKIKYNWVENFCEYDSKTNLRKDQVKAVESILKKTSGIVRGPCSSGKSVIGLEAIALSKQVGLVVVWEKIHQIQWIKEALRDDLMNLTIKDIGGAGGVFSSKKEWEKSFPNEVYPGNKKVGRVNICMLQSLRSEANQEIYFPICGMVVCDECQRFGANSFRETLSECPAKYRIGVSADEKRKDKKEFLIYDCFGKIINIIPDGNLKSRIPAKINLLPTSYDGDDYNDTSNPVELAHNIARNKKRNKIIINRTLQQVKKNKFVIIFVERRWHGLYLREQLLKNKLRVKLLVGKVQKKEILETEDWKKEWKEFMLSYDDNQEFFDIVNLGTDKELDVVITNRKGMAGLSIKTFDHGIGTFPINIQDFNQMKGRVERDYDDSLRKKFGKKKKPSMDFLWDVKCEKLRSKGKTILTTYANVNVLQKRRKKNG
jgi:superfamily II DNA or RNA helicase